MKTDALPTDDGRRTWDRQPGETAAAFAAFVVYLDAGPGRTLAAAYRKHRGKPDALRPSGRFEAWARDHDWKGRADAHDLHLRREKVRAFVALDIGEQLDEFRADMAHFADEQIRLSRQLIDIAQQMTERYLRRFDDPDFYPSARDVRQLALAARDIGEHSINAKGAALGVDQMLRWMQDGAPMGFAADIGAPPSRAGARRSLLPKKGEA